MDKTVYATQVDEYTVRGDVFDSTFQDLAFFQFANDFFLLLFQLSFDKSFVRNHHVFEFLVDFNHFEFHGFVNKYVVVADRFNVDLRTWQECFDTKYVNNHTAFSTAFDKAFDDFVVVKSFVNAFPRLSAASFFVRKHQLTFFIFLRFDVNFYFVTDLQFGIVTEFVHWNDTVWFVTDVYNNFAFVHCDYSTFNHVVCIDLVQCLVVGFFLVFFADLSVYNAVFECVPVKIV